MSDFGLVVKNREHKFISIIDKKGKLSGDYLKLHVEADNYSSVFNKNYFLRTYGYNLNLLHFSSLFIQEKNDSWILNRIDLKMMLVEGGIRHLFLDFACGDSYVPNAYVFKVHYLVELSFGYKKYSIEWHFKDNNLVNCVIEFRGMAGSLHDLRNLINLWSKTP